ALAWRRLQPSWTPIRLHSACPLLRAFRMSRRVAARRAPRSPKRLVAIHTFVARREQFFERGSVLGKTCGAGADRERHANAGTRLEGMGGHRILQVGHAPLLVLGRAIPENHDEFVAAEPRAQVVLTDRVAQNVANRSERAIADFMSVRVVDLL